MSDATSQAEFQGEAWPFYPRAFLHDAARCLALAHQGRLSLAAQGQLSRASLHLLARQALLEPETASPGSEREAPDLSFLVRLLGRAGLVADVGEVLRLTDAAHAWLGQPAPRQIEQLRDAWWFAPEVNTCWLPPHRRQWSPHGRQRRLILEAAGWIAALPTSGWTPAAAFHHHLEEQDYLSAGRGRNLPRVRRAPAARSCTSGPRPTASPGSGPD